MYKNNNMKGKKKNYKLKQIKHGIISSPALITIRRIVMLSYVMSGLHSVISTSGSLITM